jgi:hypothetical protein
VPAVTPDPLLTLRNHPICFSEYGVPQRAISSAGERFPDTEEVTGSIPVSRTTSPPPGPRGSSYDGRLAQGESASFTPKRSLVRSQYRPRASRESPACGKRKRGSSRCVLWGSNPHTPAGGTPPGPPVWLPLVRGQALSVSDFYSSLRWTTSAVIVWTVCDSSAVFGSVWRGRPAKIRWPAPIRDRARESVFASAAMRPWARSAVR